MFEWLIPNCSWRIWAHFWTLRSINFCTTFQFFAVVNTRDGLIDNFAITIIILLNTSDLVSNIITFAIQLTPYGFSRKWIWWSSSWPMVLLYESFPILIEYLKPRHWCDWYVDSSTVTRTWTLQLLKSIASPTQAVKPRSLES